MFCGRMRPKQVFLVYPISNNNYNKFSKHNNQECFLEILQNNTCSMPQSIAGKLAKPILTYNKPKRNFKSNTYKQKIPTKNVKSRTPSSHSKNERNERSERNERCERHERHSYSRDIKNIDNRRKSSQGRIHTERNSRCSQKQNIFREKDDNHSKAKSVIKDDIPLLNDIEPLIAEKPRNIIPSPTPKEQNEKSEIEKANKVIVESVTVKEIKNYEDNKDSINDKEKYVDDVKCNNDGLKEVISKAANKVINETENNKSRSRIRSKINCTLTIQLNNEEDDTNSYKDEVKEETKLMDIEDSKIHNEDTETKELTIENQLVNSVEAEKEISISGSSSNPILIKNTSDTVEKLEAITGRNSMKSDSNDPSDINKEISVNYNTPQFTTNREQENEDLNYSYQDNELFDTNKEDCIDLSYKEKVLINTENVQKVQENKSTPIAFASPNSSRAELSICSDNSIKRDSPKNNHNATLEQKTTPEDKMKEMLINCLMKPQNEKNDSNKNDLKLKIETINEMDYIKDYLKDIITRGKKQKDIDAKINTPNFGSAQKKCSFKF